MIDPARWVKRTMVPIWIARRRVLEWVYHRASRDSFTEQDAIEGKAPAIHQQSVDDICSEVARQLGLAKFPRNLLNVCEYMAQGHVGGNGLALLQAYPGGRKASHWDQQRHAATHKEPFLDGYDGLVRFSQLASIAPADRHAWEMNDFHDPGQSRRNWPQAWYIPTYFALLAGKALAAPASHVPAHLDLTIKQGLRPAMRRGAHRGQSIGSAVRSIIRGEA